jgi:hypothetical protein
VVGGVDGPRQLDHIGPIRRATYFLLGVAVILDGIIQTPTNLAELIVGLVLLGLIPVDGYVNWLQRPPGRRRPRRPVDACEW